MIFPRIEYLVANKFKTSQHYGFENNEIVCVCMWVSVVCKYRNDRQAWQNKIFKKQASMVGTTKGLPLKGLSINHSYAHIILEQLPPSAYCCSFPLSPTCYNRSSLKLL